MLINSPTLFIEETLRHFLFTMPTFCRCLFIFLTVTQKLLTADDKSLHVNYGGGLHLNKINHFF